jgi:hypothetical protein
MKGAVMKSAAALLAVVVLAGATQGSFAAIKYKRFDACPEGAVTADTCECRAAATGRFKFCHKGNYCDTKHGLCSKTPHP